MTTPKGSPGPDDPRRLGGDIAGPGGPLDRDAVIFDTTNAVLLESTVMAVMHNRSDGRDVVGVLLEGRINRTNDRARVLFLTDGDGAAALLTEALSLMKRAADGGMRDLAADIAVDSPLSRRGGAVVTPNARSSEQNATSRDALAEVAALQIAAFFGPDDTPYAAARAAVDAVLSVLRHQVEALPVSVHLDPRHDDPLIARKAVLALLDAPTDRVGAPGDRRRDVRLRNTASRTARLRCFVLGHVRGPLSLPGGSHIVFAGPCRRCGR
jgi:hypothetical protein